jgi:nitrogen fixation/metabolism regulation signal transduction histidine kinase
MEESTHFAPALRSTAEQILKEYELVGSQKIFTEIFGSLTGIAGVIDKNRQIVYANDELLSLMGIKTLEPILGKRPGEVISCINSAEEESGCGTSHACAYCGAVNAILESQSKGMKSIKETQISTIIDGKHKSWDLNVISTPISFNGEVFYILILQDISDEKRRIALERIFFHDLLNSMGALNGLISILREETNPDEKRELLKLSEEISQNVIDEILSQRQIRAAENGELMTNIELCNSIELLDLAIGKINFHEAGNGRNIVRTEDSLNMFFATDKILLQRVIVNLLKNALEATPLNGTVTTGIRDMDDKIVFWVKNDMLIPTDTQMQLFQRSFSTKGTGRGLGTYSIRLLTENYLEGKVSFISNETDRTVFSIELNKIFPTAAIDRQK